MVENTRIAVLQHVSFECPNAIGDWAAERAIPLEVYHVYKAPHTMPDIDDFSHLVVLGGAMGVGDEADYPWLVNEKAFLKKVIEDTDKPIFGICLGAQLLAYLLGADVKKNPQPEIGWWQVEWMQAEHPWVQPLTQATRVFHWHSDCFAIPDNALHIAQNETCCTQGFIWQDRIMGLQCHIEMTEERIGMLVAAEAEELARHAKADYVQSAEEILTQSQFFAENKQALSAFMDAFIASR